MSAAALLEVVLHGAGEARLDAVFALGEQRERAAVGPIIQCLREPDATLRATACEALGTLGDPRAVPPLVSMLRDADDDVRGEAFSALLRIGQARAAALPADAFVGEDPTAPSLALTQIVWPADLEAIKLLYEALPDPDPEIRIGAAYALGRLGIMSAFGGLLRLLSADPDADVRAAAAFAISELGMAGDARAADALVDAWHRAGDEDEVAVLIVRGLVDLGPARAFTVFEQALQHRDARVRQLAIMGFARLADPVAVSKLARSLRDPHPGVRRNAALALGHLGSEGAIQPLIQAVPGEGAEVRSAIGEALDRLDRAAVHAALRATLEDARPAARAAATYLMGRISDADGLERALSDADPSVRKAAALAVGRCAQPRLRPLLEGALTDADWTVRVAAAQGLRRLGDPTARAALQPVAEDPHPVVRNAVQVALRALSQQSGAHHA